jgi:MFS transporter, OFA family, oxalate/formate antiporter
LPHIDDVLTFQVIVYVVMTCYGGGFATLPAYIGDLFGTRQVSAIHGYVLTAWALAGISGSSLIAAIRDATGSFDETLHIFSTIFLAALGISIVMMVFVQRKRRQLHAQEA